MQNRRQMLRSCTAGAFAIGSACPGWLGALAARTATDNAATKLVVIELTGGNDGLNTVIPVDHDVYRQSRPTLAIAKQDAIMLSDTMAFHPSLKPLMKLWQDNQLAVIQNVGYPNPNRSHFRSMEIWQSATLDDNPLEGWLGKLADLRHSFRSLHVGNSELPLAVRRGSGGASPTIASLEDYQLRQGATLSASFLQDQPEGLLARIAQRTETAAKMAARASQLSVPDSESPMESHLLTAHRMMRTDPAIRVFYTARDGFDTHQRQSFMHTNLLQDVARSIGRFTDALRNDNMLDQVLILVYSEFGRRVKENGSLGTDHGAAAPLFAIGGKVVGGLHGNDPDLLRLRDGDLRFGIDFRDVYATALRTWLQTDPTQILGEQFETLPFVAEVSGA